MKIHAYDELYLDLAKERFGVIFDYLFNYCHLSYDEIDKIVKNNKVIDLISTGYVYYIAGKSGIELAMMIAEEYVDLSEIPEYFLDSYKTPEYWAGWALAQYAWEKCKIISDVFYGVSFAELVKMYYPYHEMDITHFIDDFHIKVTNGKKETNLKLLRVLNDLSQRELAEKANVSLRSIQLYEQGVNDINKGQAMTLYQLAKALHRNVEELLEN